MFHTIICSINIVENNSKVSEKTRLLQKESVWKKEDRGCEQKKEVHTRRTGTYETDTYNKGTF